MAVAAVWDLQRCAVCCCLVPGCGSSSSNSSGETSLRSAFPVVGLPKFSSRGGKGRSTLLVTRSLYSPLVESFGTPLRKLSTLENDSGAWISSSTTDTQILQTESGVNAGNEGVSDISVSTPEDLLTSACADEAHAEKLADIDMKKGARGRPKARAGPPSMSLSQGFSSVSRRAVSHTVGAVGGRPLSSAKVPGPIGFVMAVAVAILGVKTAVEKQGLMPGTPQKICEKCEGYGVQQCHVCQGRGILKWEGKLRHTDPCPLCIGSCLKKCSSCGGVKMKKGLPSTMTAQPGSNKK